MNKLPLYYLAISAFLFITFSQICSGQIYTSQTPNCDTDDYGYLINSYTEYLKKFPFDFEVLYRRGAAYSDVGQNELALMDLNKAIEINPEHDKAYFYRGSLYAEWGNYMKSIVDFNHAIRINPDYDDSYYMRGRSFDYLDDYETAIENANQALTLNWKNPIYYYLRGANLRRLKMDKGSIEDFKLGIQYLDVAINEDSNNPCQSGNYMMRAIFYSALRDFNSSMKDHNKAIELEPKFYEPYYYRAMLYRKLEKDYLVIDDLTKALELNPNFAEGYNKRAETYFKLGQKEKAKIDQEKYQELSRKVIGN